MTKNNFIGKPCLVRYLFVGLLLSLLGSVASEAATTRAKIQSAYFNSDKTVIFETQGHIDIQSVIHKSPQKIILTIKNAKFSQWDAEISSDDLEIDFDNKGDAVLLEIETRSKDFSLGDVTLRTILEDQAYELNIDSLLASNDIDSVLDSKARQFDEFLEDLPEQDLQITEQEEISHQLSAVKNSFLFFDHAQESESQKFIDTLDTEQIETALEQEGFEENLFESVDSTSLQMIGDALAKSGYKDKALEAYRKAIEVNPDNLQAQLGLARNTPDQMQRTKAYLRTLSAEALLSVADHWFEVAQQDGNPQTLSASMLAYQFAILKAPKNPSLRFRYGNLLERSGSENYKQASKRYYEAASLAKQNFSEGDQFSESLMRKSLEALIRLEAMQGQFETAHDYCQSYLALGYKKFSYGDKVQAFMKKIRSKRNPFWRVTQEFRKSWGLKG